MSQSCQAVDTPAPPT